LRARAGANRHHALSEIWLGGVHLAIASLVVWYAAVPAVEDFLGLLSRHALIVAPWTGLLSVVLPVAILAAMWRRRYWLVLLLAPITPLLIPLSTWERYGQSPLGWSGFQAVAEVLPIVAIAALTLTLMRAGRSLTIGRWSGSIMMIAVLAACCTTRLFGFDTHFLGIDVVVGALVLGWTIIDVRVPIGLGLVAGTVIVPVLAETGYTMLRYQAAGFTAYDALGVAIMACVPLALLGAGALRARRQATG
jgi:hypothetical protein